MQAGQEYHKMKKWFVFAIAGLVFTGFGAWFIYDQASQPMFNTIDVYGEVPQFDFTAHTGESFGIEDMKGAVSIVDFIFTGCQSLCPLMTQTMNEFYREYRDSDKVRFVSFSVEPDNDTLPVLQEYAKKVGVEDDNWTFVRAPIQDIIQLSEKGFYLPAEGLPMGHSTKFVLVDQDGNIRGYYDSFNEESLAGLKKRIDSLTEKM